MAGLQSDDEDMPEEVTLNEGREDAQQSRRQEKENSKRLAAELKEKRKSRSEKKRKKSVADAGAVTEQEPGESKNKVTALAGKPRSRKRKGRQTDVSNSGEELEGKNVGSVMLDESVVQLLRAREKQVGKGIGEAKHKYIEVEPQPEVKKLSKSDRDGPTNSRTQIVSLNAKPSSAAIDSALDFRRSHFFGSNVKRSTAMLPTSSRPYLASV